MTDRGRAAGRVALILLVALGAAGPAAAEEARPEAEATATTDPGRVRPGRYRLDPDHALITWSLSHRGFSTFYGQFAGVSGTATLDPAAPASTTLAVAVDLSALHAFGQSFEARLRGPDVFDVARFPQARFVATRVEPTGPTTARVTGDLTLRDVTRPLAFDAVFNRAGVHPVDGLYTVGFDGRAVLRRSEFGLGAMLPGIGDEVTLRLEGEFKREGD